MTDAINTTNNTNVNDFTVPEGFVLVPVKQVKAKPERAPKLETAPVALKYSIPKVLNGVSEEEITRILGMKCKDRSPLEKKIYSAKKYVDWMSRGRVPARQLKAQETAPQTDDTVPFAETLDTPAQVDLAPEAIDQNETDLSQESLDMISQMAAGQ